MPEVKKELTTTVYCVHNYHESFVRAVFVEYYEAWEYCTEHPRSHIYQLELPASRWVAPEELNARTSD